MTLNDFGDDGRLRADLYWNLMTHDRLIRALDFTFALLGLIGTSPVILIAAIVVRLTSPGPAIFAQPRVGRDEKHFVCYKLRTMKAGTRSAASHEVAAAAITKVGLFLRRVKLDELPQLWNVLVGEMSLVGPRPCLPVQHELVMERRNLGVFSVRPGVTGIAQVGGIDMSDPARLAAVDARWVEQRSLRAYFETIFRTLRGHGSGDRAGRDRAEVRP